MKKFILIFLFLILALYDAYSYAGSIQEELASKVIRLHVIANSDNEGDQELKLKVRDAVLAYMKNKNFSNYSLAYESISHSLGEIETIAKNVLRLNHCLDEVKVTLGEFHFPEKDYDMLSFPAGTYTALRITIGKANGKNWWCVMYPTLCFSKDTCDTNEATQKLEKTLSKETFSLIAGNHKFKFKILELFQK